MMMMKIQLLRSGDCERQNHCLMGVDHWQNRQDLQWKMTKKSLYSSVWGCLLESKKVGSVGTKKFQHEATVGRKEIVREQSNDQKMKMKRVLLVQKKKMMMMMQQ